MVIRLFILIIKNKSKIKRKINICQSKNEFS